MVTFTGADDLAGAELVDVDLHGARFRGANLHRARMRGVDLTRAEIDGDIAGLTINGVEVGPLVEAELDRRHPERAVLRARDAESLRTGWAGLEAMWTPTMERAAALPPGAVDVSVDGEWSFVQTLRHLVFATDTWLRSVALGFAGGEAYHPIGVPYGGWREQSADLLDLDAAPSYDEVVEVRAGRVAMVRDFLATLADDQFDEPRTGPVFVRGWTVTVRDCVETIVSEEWHHHRYAVRDLAVVEAGPGESGAGP